MYTELDVNGNWVGSEHLCTVPSSLKLSHNGAGRRDGTVC